MIGDIVGPGTVSYYDVLARKLTDLSFFTQIFFFQNDSEWLEMDFKHNFSQCNILTRKTPPPPPPM